MIAESARGPQHFLDVAPLRPVVEDASGSNQGDDHEDLPEMIEYLTAAFPLLPWANPVSLYQGRNIVIHRIRAASAMTPICSTRLCPAVHEPTGPRSTPRLSIRVRIQSTPASSRTLPVLVTAGAGTPLLDLA